MAGGGRVSVAGHDDALEIPGVGGVARAPRRKISAGRNILLAKGFYVC